MPRFGADRAAMLSTVVQNAQQPENKRAEMPILVAYTTMFYWHAPC
jgi:hypothetical protein